jgi:hypothetical protein
MNVKEIIAHIDSEIARLERVKGLLLGTVNVVNIATGKQRILSADARARIAAAQRKRWAKVHAAAKKAA